MKFLTNVLSMVGRPVITVHLPKLNLEILAQERASLRGRPFGRKASPKVEERAPGRPTKEDSLRIMFQRIEAQIAVQVPSTEDDTE